jgi:FMNH2-dependent dimethyl sulfone monooxygenase
MHTTANIEELRRATNPLFNDRKLKLGTFCTNLNGGCAISTSPETLKITWPNAVRLAQIADVMEFEALVPVGRWKGFGGVTNFNGAGFECFSWAAGIGAVTKYPAVFATSYLPQLMVRVCRRSVLLASFPSAPQTILLTRRACRCKI